MRLFILGMCLSCSLWAQRPYFIESIDFSKSVELEHVLHSVAKIAKKTKHLVSLGESHLHPVTARAVQSIFVDTYLDSANEFKFCSESIKDFLEHDAGRELRGRSLLTEISQGNSPHRTDFRGCRERGIKGYITYSGFFHQLPFARPFPLEFTPTPVITEDGENIRDQLDERNSLFIIQMELEYIEMITQGRLIKAPPIKVNDFRERVSELVNVFENAKKAQKNLIAATIPEREKVGVFIGKRAFDLLPLDAFLLVTDLAYRRDLKPLPLARMLTKLGDGALEKLLHKLAQSPAYVTGAIQEPDENGRLYETGYGTIPWRFPANSTFLEVRIAAGENVVISADPTASEASCVAYKKLGPSIVNCNEYLSLLP